MGVFSSKWLTEGNSRRAAALKQYQLPLLDEKNPERISSEPAIHAKGASEGFAGDKHSHLKTLLSPVTELSENDKARAAGFLPLLPGELFSKQISPYSHIFIRLQEDGKWYAWRETFDARGRQVQDDSGYLLRIVRQNISVKILANGVNTFEMVLMEASNYVGLL